jgi:hypothetical protein
VSGARVQKKDRLGRNLRWAVLVVRKSNLIADFSELAVQNRLFTPVVQNSLVNVVHNDEAWFFVVANAIAKFAEQSFVLAVIGKEKTVFLAHNKATLLLGSLRFGQYKHRLAILVKLALLVLKFLVM